MTEELIDTELAARLRVVLARLTRRLRRSGEPGLSSGQISALAAIEAMGPARNSDLAAYEGVSAPTFSRLMTSLETLCLISRESDPADGRASMLALTPQGVDLLERLRTERSAFLVERLGSLSGHQRAALAAALPALEALAGP